MAPAKVHILMLIRGQTYMYRIGYTQEWVMRLCNPRVCSYPQAKPRDKCKQVGIAHNARVCVVYLTYHIHDTVPAYSLRCVAT